MNKSNLYWSDYKNLEKEVLALADNIHFDDKQLNVYSIHIGTLIIRCVVEIESISKELYIEYGGDLKLKTNDGKSRDLYFDTDCLAFLNEKWKIEEKIVNIASPLFYFSDEENKILTPLKKSYKRSTSASDWKQAYQAIKHNRMNNIQKATLKNLIRSLAALYVLNLYYKNETFSLKSSERFDCSQGSSIFSTELFDTTENMLLTTSITDSNICNHTNMNKAVFVKQYDDKSKKSIEKCMKEINAHLVKFYESNEKTNKYIRSSGEYNHNHVTDLILCAGGPELMKEAFSGCSTVLELHRYRYEVVCNKHQEIYSCEDLKI